MARHGGMYKEKGHGVCNKRDGVAAATVLMESICGKQQHIWRGNHLRHNNGVTSANRKADG